VIQTIVLDDPDYRSRHVFTFHRPEVLADWLKEEKSLRARLKDIPKLNFQNLWDCQFQAITNLEQSFRENRPRALIQMATGSGKTFAGSSFGSCVTSFPSNACFKIRVLRKSNSYCTSERFNSE